MADYPPRLVYDANDPGPDIRFLAGCEKLLRYS